MGVEEFKNSVLRNGVPKGWQIGPLNKGSNAGAGFNIYRVDGQGRTLPVSIRFNPGSQYGRKGGRPYWRVSDGKTKSDEIYADIFLE